MIHFGLDPGKFVCFLSGKYTSQHRDVCRTLDAVQDHVTSDNYNHIKQILLDDCSAQLAFEEPLRNKLEFISCGNSKSFVENLQLVKKKTKKTIIVIWSQWIHFFANYLLTYIILHKVLS
jgi:hypothetical protein